MVFSTPVSMQIYQLLRVATAVGTGIVLAKSGMSLRDIGIWEVLLYMGSLVVFMGVNGLLQGIVPMYHHAGKGDDYQAVVANVFVGVTFVFVGVLWIGGRWVVPLLTGYAELPYWGWYCAYLLLSIPALPLEMVYVVRQRAWSLLVWGATGALGQMLLLGGAVGLGYGLGEGLVVLTIWAGMRLLWAWYAMDWPGLWPRDATQWAACSQYLKDSFPLMTNSMLGHVIGWFDLWLVAWWYADPAVFAVFRYGSREFPWALALATGLSTAMSYAIGADQARGLDELRQRGRRLVHMVLPVSIALVWLAPTLFPVVFNRDFEASVPLFQWMLLVAGSRVLLPGAVLTGLGDTRVIGRVAVLELILKVVLGLYMNALWGLTGVVVSYVVCCYVEKAVLAWHLWRRHGIALSRWLDLSWYLLYMVFLAASVVWMAV
jgi:O-antigen/teichoic acid export membrane protein